MDLETAEEFVWTERQVGNGDIYGTIARALA
jgi:hypothetical protein